MASDVRSKVFSGGGGETPPSRATETAPVGRANGAKDPAEHPNARTARAIRAVKRLTEKTGGYGGTQTAINDNLDEEKTLKRSDYGQMRPYVLQQELAVAEKLGAIICEEKPELLPGDRRKNSDPRPHYSTTLKVKDVLDTLDMMADAYDAARVLGTVKKGGRASSASPNT